MTLAYTTSSWELRAACRDTQFSWFISRLAGESASQRRTREAAAKQICAGCSVREECLDYALRVAEPFGIWGGLNEAERRDLLSLIAHPPGG